jgi:hypothetical protein
MSYSEREQVEVEEESAAELRIVAKQDDEANGVARRRSAVGARSDRMELAALGWDARRRRLRLR